MVGAWLLSMVLVALHTATLFGAALNPSSEDTQLRVNTLIGQNGASAVQCWAVEPPFTISAQAGTVGAKIQAIGDSSAGTVVFFDPDNDIDAGLHNAPAPQWVVTLQGSGIVTLPTTNKTIPLPTGSIIIASDTADVSAIGHGTKWTKSSVVMQLPFANSVIPKHTVINANGLCEDSSTHPPKHPTKPPHH